MRILHANGFTLMEVMIGVFLSTLLIAGMTGLLAGSVSAYRLQLSQDQLEESGRYARDVLISHISQAGYRPMPWQDSSEFLAVTNESIEGNDHCDGAGPLVIKIFWQGQSTDETGRTKQHRFTLELA